MCFTGTVTDGAGSGQPADGGGGTPVTGVQPGGGSGNQTPKCKLILLLCYIS